MTVVQRHIVRAARVPKLCAQIHNASCKHPSMHQHSIIKQTCHVLGMSLVDESARLVKPNRLVGDESFHLATICPGLDGLIK